MQRHHLVISAKRCCDETRGDLGRLSEISSRKSCLNERATVVGWKLVSAVLGLQLWQAGFHVGCFGWLWGHRPHFWQLTAGRGTDTTSSLGLSLAVYLIFSHSLLRIYGGSCWFFTWLNEGVSVHRKFLY